MAYLVFLLMFCFVVGLVGVAANPSPLFGAAALVLGAAGASGVLVGLGGSFIGLILFLIYLGGMLVVFAYSVALAADPHPEAWVDYSVLLYVLGYVVGLLVVGYVCVDGGVGAWGESSGGFFGLRSDFSGVALLFMDGGVLLLLCAWGLLLALFVVLELIRGGMRGGLRMP